MEAILIVIVIGLLAWLASSAPRTDERGSPPQTPEPVWCPHGIDAAKCDVCDPALRALRMAASVEIEKDYLTIDERTREQLKAIVQRRHVVAEPVDVTAAVVLMYKGNHRLWRFRCPTCKNLFRMDPSMSRNECEHEAFTFVSHLAHECPKHDRAMLIDESSPYAV